MNIVLGTAQLGFAYGINNTLGKISIGGINAILSAAEAGGITSYDTARSYGESEKVIGNFFSKKKYNKELKFLTKLSPLNELNDNDDKISIKIAADNSLLESLSNLKVNKIDTLMLHRFEHLTCWDSAVYQRLLEYKNEGLIEKIGISVQTPYELIFALNFFKIDHIQMPFNILDHRWGRAIKKICEVKKERNLVVHIRSCFLQGLIFNRDQKKWNIANVQCPESVWNWLDSLIYITNRRKLSEICISYIKAFWWIDGLILGVESKEQLYNNLTDFRSNTMKLEHIEIIDNSRPLLSEKTLNPSKWCLNAT